MKISLKPMYRASRRLEAIFTDDRRAFNRDKMIANAPSMKNAKTYIGIIDN